MVWRNSYLRFHPTFLALPHWHYNHHRTKKKQSLWYIKCSYSLVMRRQATTSVTNVSVPTSCVVDVLPHVQHSDQNATAFITKVDENGFDYIPHGGAFCTARDSCKLWLSIIQPLSLLSGIPINGYCCHVCTESHIPLSEMVIRDSFNTPYPAWSLLILPMMASTFLRYDTNYCKPQRGCDLSYHWLYHSFILVSSTTPQYQTYINSASATSSIDDQAC